MIGEAAFAAGEETAPGRRKALAARSVMKACFALFMDVSLGKRRY
jgi:hypothetical protein